VVVVVVEAEDQQTVPEELVVHLVLVLVEGKLLVRELVVVVKYVSYI
jgi:hypothetical protein